MPERLAPLEYYKWHWKRFRLSRNVQRLHYIAKGFYRELLDEQFAEGFIPDDLNLLADICNCPLSVMDEHWTALEKFFPLIEPGQRVNQTQEDHRTDLDKQRAASSRAGKASAEKRAAQKSTSVAENSTSVENNPTPVDDRSTLFNERSTAPLGAVQPEEKRREEERREEESLALTSPEVPAGVFDLPLSGQQGEWSLPQNLYDEMVRAYPGVNVMTQLSKMRAWLVSNPQSRKTAKGLPRFINTWLGKEQDKSGGFHGRGNSASGRSERNAEAVRSAREERERMESGMA